MRDYIKTGIGISIAGISALLGGAMVSIGSYLAAAALFVPLLAGLVLFGKGANPGVIDERPVVRAIDAGGIALVYFANLVIFQVIGWEPPMAAVSSVIGAALFLVVDRVIAYQLSGDWLGTREEVSG